MEKEIEDDKEYVLGTMNVLYVRSLFPNTEKYQKEYLMQSFKRYVKRKIIGILK